MTQQTPYDNVIKVLYVILILSIIFFAGFGIYSAIKNNTQSSDQLCVPNIGSGIYTSLKENVSIAVLDMHDPSQRNVAVEISNFFKQNYPGMSK